MSRNIPILLLFWGATLTTAASTIALTVATTYGSGAKGCRFEGLRVDGQNRVSVIGVSIFNSDRVVFNNFRIDNCTNVGLQLLGQAGGWVEQCRFEDAMINNCVIGVQMRVGSLGTSSFGENSFINIGITMPASGTPTGIQVVSFSRTVNDMVTNGTTTITSATVAFTANDVGRVITGSADIPANTTIASVTNGTTAVMSAAATGSHTGQTLNIFLAANLYRSTFIECVMWFGGSVGTGVDLDGDILSIRAHWTFENLIPGTAGTTIGLLIENTASFQNGDKCDITMVWTGLFNAKVSNPGSKWVLYKQGSHRFFNSNGYIVGPQFFLDPNAFAQVQIDYNKAGGGGISFGGGTGNTDTGIFRDGSGSLAAWQGVTPTLNGRGIAAYLVAQGFVTYTPATIVATSAGINSTETVVRSITVPANTMVAGTTYRLRASGVCTSTVANVGHFRCRIGTTTLTGNIVVDVSPTAAASGAAVPFDVDLLITIRTIGAGGTAIGSGRLLNNGVTGVSAAAVVVAQSTATVAVDTTAINLIELTFQAAAATTTCMFYNDAHEIVLN